MASKWFVTAKKIIINTIKSTSMSKSYKIPLLWAFYNNGNIKLKIDEDDNFNLLKKITYLTANESESVDIACVENIQDAINKLPNLVATAGSKGVFFLDEKGQVCLLPAMKPKELKDTTGAGDTFCGNFVVSILKGFSKTYIYYKIIFYIIYIILCMESEGH